MANNGCLQYEQALRPDGNALQVRILDDWLPSAGKAHIFLLEKCEFFQLLTVTMNHLAGIRDLCKDQPESVQIIDQTHAMVGETALFILIAHMTDTWTRYAENLRTVENPQMAWNWQAMS